MQKPNLKVLPLIGGIGTLLLSAFGVLTSLVMIAMPEQIIESMKDMELPDNGSYDLSDPDAIKLIGVGLLVFAVVGIILAIVSFVGFGMTEKKPKIAGILFLVVGIIQCVGCIGFAFLFIILPVLFYVWPGIAYVRYGSFITSNPSSSNDNGYEPIDL